MTSRVRCLRPLSPWAVVAGATVCFGSFAGAITVAGAAQRRNVWTAAAPQIYRAMMDELRRRQVTVPDMTDVIDLQKLIAEVPEPRHAIGAMSGHVLVQTLIFAAVCAWMGTLKWEGHRIWSALAGSSLIVGVMTSSGPLALLAGPLAGPVTATGIPGALWVPFEAPAWWRLVVAVVAALPIVGAWLAFPVRTPAERPERRVDLVPGLSAVALLALVGELTVLIFPEALAPDSLQPGEAEPAWVLMLVLATCASVAGTAASRVGKVLAASGGALAMAAVASAWLPYHLGDEAHQAFGWELASGQPVWHLGTPETVALVLLAPGVGWLAGSLSHLLRRRQMTDPRLRGAQSAVPHG